MSEWLCNRMLSLVRWWVCRDKEHFASIIGMGWEMPVTSSWGMGGREMIMKLFCIQVRVFFNKDSIIARCELRECMGVQRGRVCQSTICSDCSCRKDSYMLHMKPVYLLIVGWGGGDNFPFLLPTKSEPEYQMWQPEQAPCIIYEAVRRGQSIIQGENIPLFCHKS
jgi:hypothetical protein